MNKKIDTHKLLIVVLIFIITLVLISILFYINLNKDDTKNITATVLTKENGYIIVEDNNKKEYKLNISDNIEEDDVLSITIDNIDENKTPITANVKNISTISKTIHFTIEDKHNDDVVDANNINEINTTNTKDNTIYTEEEVISYVKTLESKIDDNSSITDTIKEKFVTLVDFIFYDGTIGGKTFNELSSSAKLEIISLALKIDSKIEEKFPNYKEELSNKGTNIYTNIKEKSIELYLDITTNLCQNNEETSQTAKEGLNDLKESFSLTWSFIKTIAKDNLGKLKNWYEVWREN